MLQTRAYSNISPPTQSTLPQALYCLIIFVEAFILRFAVIFFVEPAGYEITLTADTLLKRAFEFSRKLLRPLF